MPISDCLDNCSFLVSLEIGGRRPPTLFIFFSCFDIPSLLHFHINFRISLLLLPKELAGYLLGLVKSVWGELIS